MNLKELRLKAVELEGKINACDQATSEIDVEINQLRDKVQAEKRAMTDEERIKLTALTGRKATQRDLKSSFLDDKKVLMVDLAEAEAANEAIKREPDPGLTADADAAKRANGVVTGADLSDGDPKRGFKTHREFMSTVMQASRFGKVDPRLKPLATVGSDEHGSHSDPSAAFLIPVAFAPDLLAVQAEGDPTAPLTRKMPMTAPTVKQNARVDKNQSSSVSGGLVVYRHSETNEITPSRMSTEQLTFTAEDLVGAAYATENQISDSPTSFIALIGDGFGAEFNRKLLREKVRGTGAGGQYLGALNSPALITVAKETGQKAATILTENIDKMAARCWGYDSERTVYLANQTTRPQLRALKREVGTGGTTVGYFSTDGGVERLDGKRIFFTPVCSALGALGDLVLVNWSEYIEGLYQPLQQAESIHVRFLNNERAFKFWLRNCGMPWWSAALTPENGDTLSPLVTLAARA